MPIINTVYGRTFSWPCGLHTSYLSRIPWIYPCKFFLAGVNFYRFSAKNWHFLQILLGKVAFFGVNFILQKFCPCRKNDKLEVCARVCQSMPEYARVCQSMPEYARVCQTMPDYARLCQTMQ